MVSYRDKIQGPGQMDTKVKGTSYRQNELLSICQDHDGFHGVNKRCAAFLISEPTNPYDSNAIRVEIEGRQIGYLPRQWASSFGGWLSANGFSSIHAPCDALIVGGWGEVWTDSGIETEEGDFGVRLDIALPGSAMGYEDLDPFADHIFTPMRQGRITGNTLITEMEATELRIGSRVNFWLNRHDNSFIGLYASGGCGGSSRLGLLPDRFHKLVAPHLKEGLPIDATIDRIENGICFVRFRLVPREAVEQAQHEATEKRRAALLKPYKPIKPMKTVIVPTSAECRPLRRGTMLVFREIPTLDECLSSRTLFLCTEDGLSLYVTDDQEFKSRVFRLGELRSAAIIRVVQTNRTKYSLSYEIELCLPDVK